MLFRPTFPKSFPEHLGRALGAAKTETLTALQELLVTSDQGTEG